MSYKIKAVNGTREWESSAGGQMVSYTIDLTDPEGKLMGGVELAQKKSTAAPSVGQELDGTIEQSKFGPKFKKAYGGGGRGGGGGGRPRDPNERKSIERQVAFKGAIEVVAAGLSGGSEKLDLNSTKSALTEIFNHGLTLIQADAAELVEEVFPGTEEVPAGTPIADGPPGGSPHEHAIKEMRDLYAAWADRDEGAPGAWQNKLTSMGLKAPQDANDLEIDELITFLKEQA